MGDTMVLDTVVLGLLATPDTLPHMSPGLSRASAANAVKPRLMPMPMLTMAMAMAILMHMDMAVDTMVVDTMDMDIADTMDTTDKFLFFTRQVDSMKST